VFSTSRRHLPEDQLIESGRAGQRGGSVEVFLDSLAQGGNVCDQVGKVLSSEPALELGNFGVQFEQFSLEVEEKPWIHVSP
jgi:hypothetical protein